VLGALLGTALAPSMAAADGAAPRVVVQKISDQTIAVLADKGLSAADKRARVEQIVYANTDFDTLSRLVLARNWSSFSPAQQAQFVAEFKRHLSVTYGKNVENYRNEKVTITGDHEEARGDWTVNSKILRGGAADDILIDYRLRPQGGAWKIIDFVIERVSLVANFRSQFQDVLSQGPDGPDRLLKLLHEKNERGEPLKTS
jgi:phospholipid transport system substrate-binding protein